MSSGATWPRRSLVAWTDWEIPFENFEPTWAKLREDWRDFQPCMMGKGETN